MAELIESDLSNKTAAERRALKLEYLIPKLRDLLPHTWTFVHPARGTIGIRVSNVGYRDDLLAFKVQAALENGKRLAVASPIMILNPPMKARGSGGSHVWNPLLAIRQDLQHTVSLFPALLDGQVVDDADPTLTVYPDASSGSVTFDGYCGRTGASENLATIRAGSGTAANVTDSTSIFGRLRATTTSNLYSQLYRGGFTFDTTSLLANYVVTSVTFSLKGTNKANGNGSAGLDVVSFTPAADNAMATGDFANYGTTVKATISYASWSTSAYNDFTLAAGDVNLAGITRLGTRLTFDTANSGATWASAGVSDIVGNFADLSGTASDPKLVVVYTVPRRLAVIS